MNYDKWDNKTALGYLKYALEHYNKRAGGEDYEECRPLTEGEMRRIVGCMQYAFDMKTQKEAYELK